MMGLKDFKRGHFYNDVISLGRKPNQVPTFLCQYKNPVIEFASLFHWPDLPGIYSLFMVRLCFFYYHFLE